MTVLENGDFLLAATPVAGKGRTAQHTAALALAKALLTAAGAGTARICRDRKGRPYAEGAAGIDFNWAHTDTLAVCALSRTVRVGVDAEPIAGSPASAEKLAKRYFAPRERAFYENAADPARAFLTVFTRKEAFAKYTGAGLAATIVLDTMAPDFETAHGVRFAVFEHAGHLITVCRGA